MSVTTRKVPHPPAAVLAVLTDGWRYADWVVGARQVRGVDEGFPAPGTKIHHSVGVGPLTIDDTTLVVAFERPDGPVVLEARAWPVGTARVTITVRPDGEGSEVAIGEEPNRGPARTIHNPLLDRLLHLRNVECLRRLDRAVGTPAGARASGSSA